MPALLFMWVCGLDTSALVFVDTWDLGACLGWLEATLDIGGNFSYRRLPQPMGATLAIGSYLSDRVQPEPSGANLAIGCYPSHRVLP